MTRPVTALAMAFIALILSTGTASAASPKTAPAASRNTAPVVNAGADQTITLPSSAALKGTVTDDGLPSGRLNQTWSKVNGPGSVKFGSSSSKSTTATFSVAGSYTLRLTANDSSLTSSDDLIVTVKSAPANQYPVVSAGAGTTIALPAAATLRGTVTDDGLPNGTLTQVWSTFSGPGTVTFANAAAASTTASFSVAGTYVLRLTANDSALSASADVTVVAVTNQAPVVSAGAAQTLTLPASATLSGSVSDDGYPAGGVLTQTWSLVSGPGTVSFGNASAAGTAATFSAAGAYTLRLTASDGALTSASTVAVTATAATSTQQPGAIPSTLFGMHLIDKKNWPTYPIGALGKGTFINWPYIEQTSGVFDWSNLDAWVNQAQSSGVQTFVALELAPGWAVADKTTCVTASGYTRCTGMPDLTALDRFVTAMVTRYAGRIAMYELYNEPDTIMVGYNGFSGTVADLVTLTQHEYNIIRKLDPAALIGAPSGGSTYMDSYWAAGGVKTVDTLDFHLYPDSSRYTTSQYAAAERVQFWPDSNKAVFAKYGLTQPIWMTEGSWNNASGVMANDADQMAYVARSYLLHWSKGISRAYWYASDQSNLGTMWDPTNGEHAAARALRQVYNWMVGAVMPSPCATAGNSVLWPEEPAQYACTLTRQGGYQALAIWNVNGPAAFTPPSLYKQYRDLDGNVVPITGAITIGFKPLLLETGTAP